MCRIMQMLLAQQHNYLNNKTVCVQNDNSRYVHPDMDDIAEVFNFPENANVFNFSCQSSD